MRTYSDAKGQDQVRVHAGAFHGKTHGPLSVTTATDVQSGFIMGVPKENVIHCRYGDIDSVREVIARESGGGKNPIIAVMIETLRGTSCESPPPGYFEELVDLCRKADILTIFDEVKVGMGRTGRFCAFQFEDAVPDVVTLAKTLGGGKREVGAMVTSQALFDQAYGSTQTCNLHSSSFSGMGGSCAVAIETLNVIDEEHLIERAARVGRYLRSGLEKLQQKYPRRIASLRGKGCFQAIEFAFGQETAGRFLDVRRNPLFVTWETVLIGALTRELFDRHGILVHFQPGARDLIHLMPPFIVEETEIDRLLVALDDVLDRGIADATVRFVIKNIKGWWADGLCTHRIPTVPPGLVRRLFSGSQPLPFGASRSIPPPLRGQYTPRTCYSAGLHSLHGDQPGSLRCAGLSLAAYRGLSLDISLSAAATAIALLTLVANVLLIHGLVLRGSGTGAWLRSGRG
ncbi:aminotransferase class III-fold pyridoxal phosphate-dependent enzyme [Novosphingobium panipatense]